jgi:hypothetical protein
VVRTLPLFFAPWPTFAARRVSLSTPGFQPMPMDFDAYHKWLGISPKDQPPNHYRLLALDLYESDQEVIDTAANRQMSYLQQRAAGQYAALSQKLLNEIAAARLCLLNPEQKAVYDAELKKRLEGQPGITEPSRSDSPEPDSFAFLQSREPSKEAGQERPSTSRQPFDPKNPDSIQRKSKRGKSGSSDSASTTLRRVVGSIIFGWLGILVAFLLSTRSCEKQPGNQRPSPEVASAHPKTEPTAKSSSSETGKSADAHDTSPSSPSPKPDRSGTVAAQPAEEEQPRLPSLGSSATGTPAVPPAVGHEARPPATTTAAEPVASDPIKLVPKKGDFRRRTETDLFRVHPDGSVAKPWDLPHVVHGKSHPELRNWPRFSVNSFGESALEFMVEKQSKAGGAGVIECYVDGTSVETFKFPGTGEKTLLSQECGVRIPPGLHEIEIRNTGKAWVAIGWYRFRGRFAESD